MSAPFLLLVLLLIAAALWAILVFYWTRREEQEKKRLEKRLYQIDRAFTTLTSISSVDSAIQFITEELVDFGFSRVVVFTIDRKNNMLVGQTAIGFGPDFNPKKLQIPIKDGENIVGRAVFLNEFTVIEEASNISQERIGVPTRLGAFMVAPIVKKSGVWSSETMNFYPEINQIHFPVLGAILAGRGSISSFTREDKELFQGFAFQTGAVLEKGYILSELKHHEDELNNKIYEVSILKELGDRIGYQLNIQKIADIISGSLNKLLRFSAVAYMLFTDSGKVIFKTNLEESVSRKFIDEIKKRMLNSLSALAGHDISPTLVDENITGTIVDEGSPEPVRSFFNIPLTINEKLAGVLTVASTQTGLYQESEMTILYKIVNQASTAVAKLEAVLAVEKEKLTAMVSSMADGVIMVDQNLVLTIINPAANMMLKMTGDNTNIFDVVDSLEGKINLRTKLEEAIATDNLIVVDNVFLEETAIRILISPVKDFQKNPLGAVVLLHNITKEKELEKLRQEFTAMMVHELRAPLTAIRGSSDILLLHQEQLKKTEVEDLMRVMKKESEDMLKLVSDLLDVAKLEQGKFTIEKVSQEITPTLEDQVKSFQSQAKEKELTIRLEVDKNISTIEFDRTRISQVLSNLLLNAIKFTDRGGVITVIAKKNHSQVVVSVSDTGVGMNTEQVEGLFNKFKQLKITGTEGEQGTGLGLVIARGIIEAHGGKLWVESREKIGSTFYFSIPITEKKENLPEVKKP